MRLNKFIAQATGLGRRQADKLISEGRVSVNGQPATLGIQIDSTRDSVSLDGKTISFPSSPQLVLLLHKPAGYVVSRKGQGNRTIYDLLPEEYHSLKPIGRLDKDTSGLLLLSNDGDLTFHLSHPRFVKQKQYEIDLDRPLEPSDRVAISGEGIELEDGISRLDLTPRPGAEANCWVVTMHEGRNRQIRRTFEARRYEIRRLHRISFGDYRLRALQPGQYTIIESRPEA